MFDMSTLTFSVCVCVIHLFIVFQVQSLNTIMYIIELDYSPPTNGLFQKENNGIFHQGNGPTQTAPLMETHGLKRF